VSGRLVLVGLLALALALALLLAGCYQGKLLDNAPLELGAEDMEQLKEYAPFNLTESSSLTVEYAVETDGGYIVWLSYLVNGEPRHQLVGYDSKDFKSASVNTRPLTFKVPNNDYLEVAGYGSLGSTLPKAGVVAGYAKDSSIDRVQFVSDSGTWLVQVYDGRFLGVNKGAYLRNVTSVSGLNSQGETVYRFEVSEASAAGRSGILGFADTNNFGLNLARALAIFVALGLAFAAYRGMRGQMPQQCKTCKFREPDVLGWKCLKLQDPDGAVPKGSYGFQRVPKARTEFCEFYVSTL